jgi:hypothetical protein
LKEAGKRYRTYGGQITGVLANTAKDEAYGPFKLVDPSTGKTYMLDGRHNYGPGEQPQDLWHEVTMPAELPADEERTELLAAQNLTNWLLALLVRKMHDDTQPLADVNQNRIESIIKEGPCP